MKLKAKLGNWSGIVGMGVHLIGPNGRVEAQIAFINHGEALRDEVVAGVPVLDLDDVAGASEPGNLVRENQLCHVGTP